MLCYLLLQQLTVMLMYTPYIHDINMMYQYTNRFTKNYENPYPEWCEMVMYKWGYTVVEAVNASYLTWIWKNSETGEVRTIFQYYSALIVCMQSVHTILLSCVLMCVLCIVWTFVDSLVVVIL